MTPNSSHQNFEELSNIPPPPPPPGPTAPKVTKRNKKRFILGISAGLVLALGISGFTVAYSVNTEKLAEYEEAYGELSEYHQESLETLESAGALEPAIQEAVEAQLTTVGALLNADAPGVMNFGIADRTIELEDERRALQTPVTDLATGIKRRVSYDSALSTGKDLLDESEELLKKTQNKVLDDQAHETLSGHAGDLKEALAVEPDETSADSYTEATTAINAASDEIEENTSTVSTSHDEWVDAEEEAAKQDPANYKTLSARDWQLVERDPDAYEGEKYVLFGAVTQADAMTGEATIRVDTGPVQQSRRYNYDVNTMLLTGSSGVFSDVVQGDHVKMLVEVTGSMTYDTTIGGSASAVMALAYDVDVIGQF